MTRSLVLPWPARSRVSRTGPRESQASGSPGFGEGASSSAARSRGVVRIRGDGSLDSPFAASPFRAEMPPPVGGVAPRRPGQSSVMQEAAGRRDHDARKQPVPRAQEGGAHPGGGRGAPGRRSTQSWQPTRARSTSPSTPAASPRCSTRSGTSTATPSSTSCSRSRTSSTRSGRSARPRSPGSAGEKDPLPAGSSRYVGTLSSSLSRRHAKMRQHRR